MKLFSFFSRRNRTKAASHRSLIKTLPLRLEFLEDRVVPAARLWTDLSDYAPGSTATIMGSGFGEGETIQLQVVHQDGLEGGEGHEPWLVTDGGPEDLDGIADGSFRTTWYVNPDDNEGADLVATATGLSSGEFASTLFTDGSAAPSAKLGQWADLDTEYQNGDLNQSNSTYFEGDSVAFRYFAADAVEGSRLVLTIHYQYLKNQGSTTINTYDFLTSDDASEPVTDTQRYGAANASKPSGFDLMAASNTQYVAIPDDPGITLDTGTRNFRIDSNHPVSVVSAVFSGVSGDDKVITLTLDMGTDGDSDAGEKIVDFAIFFGGHLARDPDWPGADNGSGDLSGAPFHMRVEGFVDDDKNGNSDSGEKNIGAEDRSIHNVGTPDDTPPFPGNIVITGHKYEDGDGNVNTTGDQTGLGGWTITITGPAGGTATTAATSGLWSFQITQAGTYTITEVDQSGWTQVGPTSYTITFDAQGNIVPPSTGGLYNNDFYNFHNVTICGVKYYDADMNGTQGQGEPTISGWPVTLTVTSGPFAGAYQTTTDATGHYCFGDLDNADGDNDPTTGSDLAPGTYTVTEGSQTGWVATTPTSCNVTVGGEGVQSGGTATCNFGNVKLDQCGGLTLGFWSNPNGKRILQANDDTTAATGWRKVLNDLNLRKANGDPYNVPTGPFTTAYNSFRTWLLDATATNMAYMLSAQLAATVLNTTVDIDSSTPGVQTAVDPNALIYVPGLNSWSSNPQGANLLGNLYSNGTWTTSGNFVKLSEVISNANALLALSGSILAGNTLRVYAEALKIVLDGVNNSNANNPSSPGPICVVGLAAWHDDNENGVIDPGEI